jgi:hypothetical protein
MMAHWADPYMADPGCTYFIRAVHPIARIKIGTAINPAQRLAELQTSSPTPLELLKVVPGGRAMEAAWHARFAHLRRHLEWFDQTDELLAEIKAMPSADGFAARPDLRSAYPHQVKAAQWREPPLIDGDRIVLVSKHPCKSCSNRHDCPGCSLHISFNGHIVERRWSPVRSTAAEAP